MKNFTFKLFLLLGLFFIVPQQTEAQFFKKLAKHAKEKINREADRRSKKRVDKTIDKEFNKAEDALDGKNNKSKNKNIKSNSNVKVTKPKQRNTKLNSPKVIWNKFDFVPGDTVIFEDGPESSEENGEFPSKWDLHKGGAEIVNVDGTNVINFIKSGSYIIPYLKNSKEDYLPAVFTVELDVWFPKGSTTANRFWIYLGDLKNQGNRGGSNTRLTIMPHSLESGNSENYYPGTESTGWTVEKTGSWKHISIAFTEGKFKAYFNDTRLINIPHLETNPTGLTLEAGLEGMYIKNFRIAKGGVKYYDRVLTDGKIIVNGIKFDVNKATLKPESMGPINKIYQLMQKDASLNFSVEGHTDADGNESTNLILSKERGKAVMDKLISMGISKDRLKSTGWGESKPIDNNNTPEGKANNRRVEFVKF
jgi:outer membrane protein OmpA-like peptidoglycan-associated protein